ncbi:hypothetical protein PTR35_21850 [Serratia nevei]|uniref:hypothetical protein n=1 Tax=Serratia nevei TaxID=2703794 RepID=UPI00313CAD57
MPYASELKKTEKSLKESESFFTNTENDTELPVEIPSTSFTECLDEEFEADLTELRAHLQAIISGALPGFYEFQQAGYNLLYPKKVDIDALQARVNTMQIPALIQPQHTLLEQAANAFLDRFRRFRKESDLHNNALAFIKFRLEVNKAGWDEPQNRDYHQALKHGNRLSGYLSGALDLMNLLNENVEWQTPWETTRQANYDVLLNELLPVNADAHNNQYAAQTRGNLTGKQPDNIKFNAIVDSVTLDERIARETVSAEIERLSARLLSGITLTRNYAEKPDETGETSGIKRDIDSLCQVLQSVIPVVQYAGKQIQPETYQPLRQKAARTTRKTVTHELGKAWNAVGQKMQGAKATVQTLSDKGNKNKHRIVHALPGSTASDKNGDSHNINKAVFQVGIRLLDKIQQITSDMHKAIQTSRPLQQAVSHYSELDERLSGMPHNSILDAKLRTESSRWRQKADESRKQLQHVLGTITTLSDESMKQRYLSALREELNAATKPLATNTIIRDFDTQVKDTVEGLSDVQKALGQALLRLSEHGQAGGKALDKQTVSWLQQLKGIKDNLKTGITQATGQSINNFSRQGMLARWMAEWREAEKQRYLGTLSAEERAATEKHYDNVFFEVIQHYLPQLSKESDPQGERLLQRLRLEVGNAAKGNTLYPATMADILAGMKSPVQAIRDWSERKLIRGAFLAVCLGGFKLLPNLAALPLRLPIKFAITGAKVAWGAHKGRQGIRGGEGDIRDEIAEYAKQSYKTAAIKIVLSLPPGLATTLGIASIVWDVYEGGLKGAGEKVAKHIIGEAPWCALDVGSRAAAEASATALIEAAITEEEITSVSHSSPLQPQMDVNPFSDERAPVDQLEGKEKQVFQQQIRRKRNILTGDGVNKNEYDNVNESYFSSIGKNFHYNENEDINQFDERGKVEISELILNVMLNKSLYFDRESSSDFSPGGDEKFSDLVMERYHYIKKIEPNITDADARRIIFKSLEGFIKRNVDKLSYNNLYVSLQALHSMSDEDNDFDRVVSKLKSNHYNFENQFNISEESYVFLKELMYTLYKKEMESKPFTIKSPANEINAIEEVTPESINLSIIKLTGELTELTNKNIERLIRVKYLYDNEVYKLSLLDIKLLIKYLKAINDEDTIAKMNGYKPKGNYEDIVFATDLARELVSRMQLYSERFSEEELSAVIYKVTVEKNISSLNLTGIYNEFILDKERLSPFYGSVEKEKPTGYFTITDFKKSGDAESRSAFNQQFYDYRDKYNKYDAGRFAGSILTGSDLTIDEFNQKPKFIQTFAVFGKSLDNYTDTVGEVIDPELNPPQYIPGRIILMQLSSGRYFLASNLLGNTRSVIITEQEGDNIRQLLKRELVGFEKGWFSDEADARYKQYKGLYYLNKVNKMIIKPLYGDDWNKNPIKNISRPYFTLAKDDKAKPIFIDDKSTVAGTLTQGIEVAQAAYVEYLHQAMDETNPTWKVIRGWLPFYNVIYNSTTDSEYEIDSGEILLDLASILPLVKGAGTAAKSASALIKLARAAFRVGMKNGLRNFELFNYVAKHVSPALLSAASKNSLLMAKAFYDTVEPVPIRSTLKGLYKGIKSDLKLISLDGFSGGALARENIKVDLELTNDGVLKDNSGQSFIRGEKGELYHVEKNHSNNSWMLIDGKKKIPIINVGGRWWGVRNEKITKGLFPEEWAVNDVNFDGVHPDSYGIYKVRPVKPLSMQDYNYYIKNQGKFYQVKYDEGNNTLRLINPASSNRSGYFPPIILNENNAWVFNTHVGLKGGGLKDILDEIRLPGLRDVFGREIVIGEHAFKRVKYNQNKLNEMMRLAKTYAPTSNSTGKIARIQQDYKTGKEMSHAPQHDHYNSLSLDEKLDLFNKLDTDALTRGVLAGKINEYIVNINLYEAAKAADDWRQSANKATKVVLVPQNIFLKGGPGECLPASVLMGWALQSGQDAKLAKKMMGIYSAPNMAENPLYKSLFELHVDGKASEFRRAVIPDVKVSALGDAEARLFLTENASVRVDIPGHTMLLSKVNQEGKIKYVFYDPNYGLAYFYKYKDMSAFFKKKLEAYNVPENSINFYPLEYSILPGVKIKGRNLDEIINGEIPQLYKQEHVNLDGISPHEGVYSMPGDKNYIKVNDDVYQVEWDQTGNTWRVFEPANTNRSRITVAVRRDDNGEWFRHSDTGLQGGGLFDGIKSKWFSGKNSDDFGKNMSPSELDKRINEASKKDKQGYSLVCYRAAFNDARQAKVIDSEQFTWLTDEVAKRDSRGEIMDSQAYRQAFSLQNKKPMTTFASANITESGFMHVGERRTDGSVHYDHIVYVHVADNEIHLYQANGADFLLKLNGTNPREKHNNIGKHVSESHYKHHMDKERIALFDGYFSDPEVDGGPQAVFAFTPASEVRDNYRIEKNRREKGTPDEAIAGPSGITKAIEPVSPKPSIEPMLETRAYRNLSAEESGLISETSAHLKTNLGQQYNTYLTLPRENCANAATAVAKELRQAGYTDVRIMELGIWPNGGVDTMPANHYVVTAKKAGIEIAIDLTAGQFERYGFSGPIISTKDNWIYQWQQNMKDKPRLLVKMAPLSGGIGTSPFSMDYVNPQLTVPDGTLLQRPGWYKPGINPVQSIQRADFPAENVQPTKIKPAVNMPPPPPPLMRIGTTPAQAGPSSATGAVLPHAMSIGPVNPEPPKGITKPRIDEVKTQALNEHNRINEIKSKSKDDEPMYIRPEKPVNMTPAEENYYYNLVKYHENNKTWTDALSSGTEKYDAFYKSQPESVSKEKEYNIRYTEKVTPGATTAPYIDKDGNVSTPPGKATSIYVKGDPEPYYKFRVSDDGKVLVVDTMYGKRDSKVTRPGIGKSLKMNELQGEFIKKNTELYKNIEYITQENIVNNQTVAVMKAIVGEKALRASENKPIVLKPDGATMDAFKAMLSTPNIQGTARMFSTYPEFGKRIKEIRIQNVTRITSKVESSDLPGQAHSRKTRDINSSNQVEEELVLRMITLVLEPDEQVELSEDANNSVSTSDENMVKLPPVTQESLDTETFNQHTFEQALAVFMSNNSASDQVDTAYKPYIAVFKTMPASNEISLKQVEELEQLATDGDLHAQAKYNYAALVYLSGEKVFKLPIDANAIRKQIEQDREKAKYAYDWKVREKKERQRRLDSAKLNRLDAEYVRRENREQLNLLDEVVAYLESEVSARDSLMNQWRHTMSVTSLRLDLWSKFFQKTKPIKDPVDPVHDSV